MSNRKKCGLLIILVGILGFWFIPSISFGIPASELFELRIVGSSGRGLIAEPCPPNMTCTFDAPSWRDMTLGLTYLGESSITIIHIQFLQTFHSMGQYWNISNVNKIISQNTSLGKGETFFFQAKGIYTFFDMGKSYTYPLYVKITDMNENIYWLYMDPPETVIELTDSQYLSNLPYISKPALISSISFLFSILFIFVYRLRRKRKQ